jgi:hypothetical protein
MQNCGTVFPRAVSDWVLLSLSMLGRRSRDFLLRAGVCILSTLCVHRGRRIDLLFDSILGFPSFLGLFRVAHSAGGRRDGRATETATAQQAPHRHEAQHRRQYQHFHFRDSIGYTWPIIIQRHGLGLTHCSF